MVELAKLIESNGGVAADDDDVRQHLAQFAIEVTAKKYNRLR